MAVAAVLGEDGEEGADLVAARVVGRGRGEEMRDLRAEVGRVSPGR